MKNKAILIVSIAIVSALGVTALGSSAASTTQSISLAGWRSSSYGYQTASPPSYWINVANDVSSKFPGTTPGGIWLVGETDGDPATGTVLYMPSSGSYPNIRFEGSDIAEPYLTAFDNAGVKVILQVEPMNADINTLIDIVMNRYKSHPSVIGFGVDNEWYKTCSDGCKATAAEVTSWNDKLHSINPNYILMIKHFEESKLPTGIPTDVLVVCDDEDNGNLNTLVSEHVSMAGTYPSNPYGAQYGYPSDQNIWGGMTDPVKQIGDAIKNGLNSRAISVFWVDFSIKTIYPTATWNACTSNCNPVPTPTCTPNWVSGSWGTCVNGQQTRTVTDSNNCGVLTNKPISSRTCTVACAPNWVSGAWSTCTSGTQTRTVTDLNSCGVNTGKPVASQTCTMHVCAQRWSTGLWSTCIAGSQNRNVTDLNSCGNLTGKPTTTQTCTMHVCTQNWSVGSWSACAGGTQSRTVTDLNGCANNTGKPSTAQVCTMPTCTPIWSIGNWSACANGSQTRTVTDLKICGVTTGKPATTQTCAMPTNNTTQNNTNSTNTTLGCVKIRGDKLQNDACREMLDACRKQCTLLFREDREARNECKLVCNNQYFAQSINLSVFRNREGQDENEFRRRLNF
jgi:hypothetical protein